MSGGPENIPTGFPRATDPFVGADLTITWVWYQFLRQLWLRTGSAIFNLVVGTADVFGVVSITVGDEEVAVITGMEHIDGTVLQTTAQIGAAAEPQVLAASPFVFAAPIQGTLLVYGAEIEFSRDAGVTWYSMGLQGGQIPLMTNDQVRITWFSANPPPVVFMPGAAA